MVDWGKLLPGLQVVGTAIAGALCGPPGILVATGAFQILGQSLNDDLENKGDGNTPTITKEEGNNQTITKEEGNIQTNKKEEGNNQKNNNQELKDYLQQSLDSQGGINGTVTENQKMLRDLQSMLSKTAEELKGINGTVLENKEMQKKIDETQAMITNLQQKFDGTNESVIQNQELLKGLKAMLSASTEENRKTLLDIQVNLKAFEENMNQNFAELKLFMVEREFTVNVHSQIDFIWSAMNDVINSRSKWDVDKFTKRFEVKHPSEILENFVNGLQHASMNPISSAMEHHPLKSRSILEKYEHLFAHLAFKVLAMEGFYNGFLKQGSVERLKFVSRDVYKVISRFRDFVASYKLKTELYWHEAIEEMLEERSCHLRSENDFSEDAITSFADEIKEELEGIYTTDVFSIFIGTDTDEEDPDRVSESHGDDESPKLCLYAGFRSNDCNVHIFILRSENFHKMSPETLSLVRSTFRAYAFSERDICDTLPVEHKTIARSTNTFFYRHERYTDDPRFDVHGFHYTEASNRTVVARFTNGGSSILTDDDLKIVPTYYGISWM